MTSTEISFNRLVHKKVCSLSSVIDGNISKEYVFIIEPQVSITLYDDVYQERSKAYTFIVHEGGSLAYHLHVRHLESNNADTLHKHSITCCLEGNSSYAVVRCRYEGRGSTHYQLNTVQHHRSSNSKSVVCVKGAWYDSTQFTSKHHIIVDKAASNSSIVQCTKNLMISSNAHVVALPHLDINNHDVSCSHGAAVSYVRSKDIQHLQGYGIEQSVARNVIINGFLR